MKANTKWGIGLIGLGAFGEFCVDAYHELDDAEVVAVADLRVGARRRAASLGLKAFESSTALMADADVDVVAINTPPFTHAQLVIEAAKNGKHVFVEKPLAIDLTSAHRALSAVAESGVQLAVDYVFRLHPLYLLTRELVQTGLLGACDHFSVENRASADQLGPNHWFWDPEKSGGISVEHGVHFIDAFLCLTRSRPHAVYRKSHAHRDGRQDRVTSLASAIDANGRMVSASFHHAFNRPEAAEATDVRISTDRADIHLEGWIPTKLRIDGFVPTGDFDTLCSRAQDLNVNLATVPGESHKERRKFSMVALRDDRQADYSACIREGMGKLLAAAGGEDQPAAGGHAGFTSLAFAACDTTDALRRALSAG